MKYLKLYKRYIFNFLLVVIVYIITMHLFSFFLDKPLTMNELLEKSFSIISTALFMSFFLYNFPFTPNNFLSELSFSLLLPVKRVNILISRFIRDILLALICQSIYLIIFFLMLRNLAVDMNKLIDMVFLYAFEGVQIGAIFQPIFIWAHSLDNRIGKMKTLAFTKFGPANFLLPIDNEIGMMKMVTGIVYLGIPFLVLYSIFILMSKLSFNGYIFFYNTPLIRNIFIMFVFTIILLIVSFVTAYKLLSKKES